LAMLSDAAAALETSTPPGMEYGQPPAAFAEGSQKYDASGVKMPVHGPP
jgi:hypothetical protein